MKTIGLSIKRTYEGEREPYIINPNQWTSCISDFRPLLSRLSGMGISASRDLLLCTYQIEGMYINLIKLLLGGRDGDNITATLFIPYNLEVEASRLESLIYLVQDQLSKNNLDKSLLESEFAQNYPWQAHALPYEASQGTRLAYRIISNRHYTLKELLQCRYQRAYTHYQHLLLLGEEVQPLIHPSDELIDLTKHDLEIYCSLVPPTEEELRRTFGYPLCLRTLPSNQEFNKVEGGLANQTLTLQLVRNGFEPYTYTYTFHKTGDTLNLEAIKEKLEWKKRITTNRFKCFDRDTLQPIDSSLTFFVNGRELDFAGILLAETDCYNATLEIQASDYETQKQTCNLSTDQSFKIPLRRKEKEYFYELRLKNGENAQMTLRTRSDFDFHESPIEGYQMTENALLHPQPKKGFSLKLGKYKIKLGKYRLSLEQCLHILLVLSLVANVLLCIYFFCYSTKTEAPRKLQPTYKESAPKMKPAEKPRPTTETIHADSTDTDSVSTDSIKAKPVKTVKKSNKKGNESNRKGNESNSKKVKTKNDKSCTDI